MRKAILHLGFHKTGTTFLQMATQRWVKSLSGGERSIFFSSQHVPDSGWSDVRAAHALRLRQRIAHAALGTLPRSYNVVCEKLSGLGLTEELRALREFFARNQSVLIHSDENSIGANFGHAGFGREKAWPFYPNGDWLCAAFSAAAFASYTEIHLVLSLRRFDEMAVSSLKNAVRSPRRLPPLHLFSRAVSDAGIRCRILVERVSKLEFVRNVHLLDYELLKNSPNDYVDTFIKLSGCDCPPVPMAQKKINASPSDRVVLDRLVERGILSKEKRAELKDVATLIGRDVLTALAADYKVFREDMMRATLAGSKVMYYS
jgi:hypothetical protein